MEVERARLLTSAAGRAALAGLDEGLAALPLHLLAGRLRRTHAPEMASAVAEQVTLQKRCLDRLHTLPLQLLTTDGLEVMTHPAVAVRRAGRLAQLGLAVADLTCGIGGDLIACSATGMRCVGGDRDAATALLASANVPEAAIVRGTAQSAPFDLGRLALILDPARRTGGGRTFDPDAFSPPFDEALAVMRSAKASVMKTAPGIDHRRVPPECELEFVQFGRGLQEAALWMGGDAQFGLRRAVLLPVGDELTSTEPETDEIRSSTPRVLQDPESCVTRAGLVRQLAHRVGGWRLDQQIAYLGADYPVFDPLCATFELLERVPFSLSRLRRLLRERGWSPTEVRRRGFPVEPDELRRLLGKVEGEPVTLICTTVNTERLVFVCRRLLPSRNQSNA